MRVRIDSQILEVTEVKAVCEARPFFDGRKFRLIEVTKNMKYANGLLIVPDAEKNMGCGSIGTGNQILYGNLSHEFVDEAMDLLASKGYLDLSGLELQPKQDYALKYNFDEAMGKAYKVDGYDAMMQSNPFNEQIYALPVNPEDVREDNGDSEEEDVSLDDMRRTIYNSVYRYKMEDIMDMTMGELRDTYQKVMED